jgi:hypothetical protein
MQAHYLNIDSKKRQMYGFAASLADFSVSDGEVIQPEGMLTDPNISLYCLDDAHRQAIFVEMSPGIDLSQAPFVYIAQYEAAQRLIAVPYDEFKKLAQQLPPIENLIMIYTVGRSGSTLLSKVFNEVNNSLSLAEPDAPVQFVHLRTAADRPNAELIELLQSTIRFCFKPTSAKQPSICVLKLRSEAVQIMDLMQAAFPKMKNLFLYRDLIGWVASFYRLFRLDNAPEYMPVDDWCDFMKRLFNQDFTHLTAYLPLGTTQITRIQQLTLWFLEVIAWYTASTAKGIPILPFRYADLDRSPEKTLTEVFGYLGLPESEVKRTLSVFETDAQAGTSFARDNANVGNQEKLSEEQIAEINRILSIYPFIKESHFTVPGTLQV